MLLSCSLLAQTCCVVNPHTSISCSSMYNQNWCSFHLCRGCAPSFSLSRTALDEGTSNRLFILIFHFRRDMLRFGRGCGNTNLQNHLNMVKHSHCNIKTIRWLFEHINCDLLERQLVPKLQNSFLPQMELTFS